MIQGYTSLIERPAAATIAENEGDAIGHREVNRLWAIRYRRAVSPSVCNLIDPSLRVVFSEELAELTAREAQYRTKAEIAEIKLAEEARRKEEEAREAALREREELELEKARIEEEEERRRIEEEEAQREWFEEEEQRMMAEEEALEAMKEEEQRRSQTHIIQADNRSLPELMQEVWGICVQDNGAEKRQFSEARVEARTRGLIVAGDEGRSPGGVPSIAGASSAAGFIVSRGERGLRPYAQAEQIRDRQSNKQRGGRGWY